MPPSQSFPLHNNSSIGGRTSLSTSTPRPAITTQRVQENIIHQSHTNTHPRPISNSTQLLHAHVALQRLQSLPNDTVLACLAESRIYLPYEYILIPTYLSLDQHQAIIALRHWNDPDILAWLEMMRQIRRDCLNAPPNLHSDDRRTNGTVAANHPDRCPSSSNNHTTGMVMSCLHEQEPASSVEEESSGAGNPNDHNHWCYIHENPGCIKKCGDFKRHIQEHETTYYCIPPDSVHYTKDGPKCASCGISDPDPRHLNTHSALDCIDKHYTRDSSLAKHLKDHHSIDNPWTLAKQSKCTDGPKYCACGFCVSWFDSRAKQAHHVDTAHYRSLVHVRDWDINKVILGLLSRTALWQTVRKACPDLQDSSFRWDPKLASQLQSRLERSTEPVAMLCKTATAGLTGPVGETCVSVYASISQSAMSSLSSSSGEIHGSHDPGMVTPCLPPQGRNAIYEDGSSHNRPARPPYQVASPSTHGNLHPPLGRSRSETGNQFSWNKRKR